MPKAIGLGSGNVKENSATSSIDTLQKGNFVQVEGAILRRGSQPSQDHSSRWIDIFDLNIAFAQEPDIGSRINVGCAPVFTEVWFVPHLVVVYCVAVATGESVSESPKVSHLTGWRSRMGVGRIELCPGRGRIQHSNESQTALGHTINDSIPSRPLKATGMWLDSGPEKGLPHPAQACLLNARQSAIQVGIIILLQIGIDAQANVQRRGEVVRYIEVAFASSLHPLPG